MLSTILMYYTFLMFAKNTFQLASCEEPLKLHCCFIFQNVPFSTKSGMLTDSWNGFISVTHLTHLLEFTSSKLNIETEQILEVEYNVRNNDKLELIYEIYLSKIVTCYDLLLHMVHSQYPYIGVDSYYGCFKESKK